MKKEKYIVEIEMPDNDGASPLWLKDVLQSDADLEDEGRWKVSVDKQWKPSDAQMVALDGICSYIRNKADWEISQDMVSDLYKLSEQLKKLKGE